MYIFILLIIDSSQESKKWVASIIVISLTGLFIGRYLTSIDFSSDVECGLRQLSRSLYKNSL